MKYLILLLASATMMSACNFDQDPLKGSPDAVLNGKPPVLKEEPRMIPLNAVQIDVPQKVKGRVGMPLTFKATGRALFSGVDFNMEVVNLSDFPEASFDTATGEFYWIPTKVVVGSAPNASMTLTVKLSTVPTETYPKVLSITKDLTLEVVNVYDRPIIKSVTGPYTALVGKEYAFEVLLDDVDSATEASRVDIFMSDCFGKYRKSISQFMAVQSVEMDANSAAGFKAKLNLDLSTRADSLVDGDYCFSVKSQSSRGVMSDGYEATVKVLTKLSEPQITWSGIGSLQIGQIKLFSFSIFDPNKVGEISIKKITDISSAFPGSSIKCEGGSYNYRWLMTCNGIIDASKLTAQATAIINIDTVNKSTTNLSGIQDSPKSFEIRFDIKEPK